MFGSFWSFSLGLRFVHHHHPAVIVDRALPTETNLRRPNLFLYRDTSLITRGVFLMSEAPLNSPVQDGRSHHVPPEVDATASAVLA
jgi:hypothetical protein